MNRTHRQLNTTASRVRMGWIAFSCLCILFVRPVVAHAEASDSLRSTDIYSHVINTHGVQTLQAQDLFADPAPVIAQPAENTTPIADPVQDLGSPIADRLPVQHNAVIVKFPNRLD